MIEQGPGRPDKYVLADGTRVPGVTTILDRYQDCGGLIQWSYARGRDGLELYGEKAMEIGSLIHSLIEADLHEKPHPEIAPEYEQKVISGYSAWREWLDGSRIEILATEVPFVSEQYKYGGTIDAWGNALVGTVLLDWKSSKSIRSNYLVQLAAYGHLLEECRGLKISGYHVCRFSKEHGDFEHRYFPSLSQAWKKFLLLRECYEIDKELAKRVA